MTLHLVCSQCGSHDVYFDAYVNANDPTDVRTFSHTYCDACEGSCSIVHEEGKCSWDDSNLSVLDVI